MTRVEIDGRAIEMDSLVRLAHSNYGHYSMMQVRSGGARGLELHLDRLEAANQELFGVGLGRDAVRGRIRAALGRDVDASVRVTAFAGDDGEPHLMVRITDAVQEPTAPQRLMSAVYQRAAAHIKHTGTFGLTYLARAAERAGFDEGLLVAQDGTISETTIANIGFYDGTSIIWPDAPALAGITLLLLERELRARGVPMVRRTIRLREVATLRAAFVTNSTGVAPVERIDETPLLADGALMKTLADAYAAVPFDAI